MLRSGIWVRVDSRGLDPVLRCCSTDPSAMWLGEYAWMKQDKEEVELQSDLTTVGYKDRG